MKRWIVLAAMIAAPAFAQASLVVGVPNVRVGNQVTAVLGTGTKQTLYVFDLDTPTSSACNGKCAEIWPPFTLSETEAPLLSGSLGFIVRASGLKQLTFNGRPVYLFHLDRVVGDVKGHGVGGVWHVVPVRVATPPNPDCDGAFVCRRRTH